MTPRDLFALIVRVAGLAMVVAGCLDLLHLAVLVFGLPTAVNDPLGQIATAAGLYLIVGFALLAGARPITRWVYGRGP